MQDSFSLSFRISGAFPSQSHARRFCLKILGDTLHIRTFRNSFGSHPPKAPSILKTARLMSQGDLSFMKIDPFTQRRLFQFIETFRQKSGQLPTLRDFEGAHFSEALIDGAVRDGLLQQLYINLTNGPVIKVYKISV